MKGFAICAAVVVLAGTAVAGTISITISQAARISDGNLIVAVKIGNTGDEAALSVTPVLRFADKEVRGKGQPTLEPNATLEETLTLPVGPLGEGRWPYRLAVDYTDQNQYPFQALHTQMAIIGSPPPAKVAVPAIKSEEIAGSGSLTLSVKNLTAETRTAKVSVLVPEGLEASDAVRELTLDGWKEDALKVPVTNRTALAGSRYPVFVTVEYDDDGIHQAVVAQGIVTVGATESFFTHNRNLLWLIAGAVVLAWLAFVASRALRR